MWRWVTVSLIGIVVVVFGFSLVEVGQDDINATVNISTENINYDAFARATSTDYAWSFPKDHGPHPDFLTEWWYYTGNLADETGRRFGYQFTIFRRAILPAETDGDSEWRTRQIYLAHFSVSDIAADTFYHDSRFSRGAAGLAGAEIEPNYHVWVESWEVIGLNEDVTETRMTAAMDGAAIDFTLEQIKPIVFQGENGLSQKSSEPGNASYYYSIPRIATEGTITIGDRNYEVEGLSWMDREFSTSALGENTVGWDWFSLILDDNRELMLYRLRLDDGGKEPESAGLLVNPDGSTIYLPADSYTITETATWTSDHNGATYPAGWELWVDSATIGTEKPLELTVTPLMSDQELHTDPSYWEGAVRVEGDATGYGYTELTGYADNLAGRL